MKDCFKITLICLDEVEMEYDYTPADTFSLVGCGVDEIIEVIANEPDQTSLWRLSVVDDSGEEVEIGVYESLSVCSTIYKAITGKGLSVEPSDVMVLSK